MQIACPDCAARFEFPTELWAGEDMKARCPQCGGRFLIGPDGPRPVLAPTGPLPSFEHIPTRVIEHAPARTEVRGAEPPSEAAEADDGTSYMVVRGRERRSETGRRRVLVVADPNPEHRAPPAGIVAHRARFGPNTAEALPALPPETPIDAPRPGRRRPLILGAALAGLLLAAGVAAIFLVPDAPGDMPPVVLDPPAAPATGGLRVEIEAVDTLTERRAVVVMGEIINGTPAEVGPLQLLTRLTVEGKPKRERRVWCCDDLTMEEAAPVANDPNNRHYARDRAPETLTRIAAGATQGFAVIFPSVPDDLLQSVLDAQVTLEPAPAPDANRRP